MLLLWVTNSNVEGKLPGQGRSEAMDGFSYPQTMAATYLHIPLVVTRNLDGKVSGHPRGALNVNCR